MTFGFQAAASGTVVVQRRVLGPWLAGVKAGLLMNFNVTKLKSGIKRFVLLLRALRVLRCARLSLADLVDWEVSTM